MYLSILIIVKFFLIVSLSYEYNNNCYFTVFYLNGSRSYCLDKQCNEHIDIISLKDRQCQTNSLSLKFSSYLKYKNFLENLLLKNSISSYYSKARPNVERYLFIEFVTPFMNSDPFKLDHLNLLTKSISNIDKYIFYLNGNLTLNNSTLFIDKNMFYSNEQNLIDKFILIFNCSNNKQVEWILIKSIEYIQESPCPQQIQFLKQNNFQQKNISFNLILLVSLKINIFIFIIINFSFKIIFITFISIIIIILIIIGSILYNNNNNNNQIKRNNLSFNSQINLINIIERF